MAKHIQILLLLNLFAMKNSAAIAQCDTTYKWTDTMPKYGKDDRAVFDYIQNELIPVVGKCVERDSDFITSLYIVLTINDHGDVIDAQFTRPHLSPLCKDDLRKKLLTMRGWTSGKMKDVDVCTYYPIPISCLKWD